LITRGPSESLLQRYVPCEQKLSLQCEAISPNIFITSGEPRNDHQIKPRVFGYFGLGMLFYEIPGGPGSAVAIPLRKQSVTEAAAS